MSPAARTRPPSSLSLRVRWPLRLARRRASKMICSMAIWEKCGILPSLVTSWATNRATFSWFASVSGIVLFMYTSYPYPRIRERMAGFMDSMVLTLPAATSTKSQGTGLVRTMAPDDRSLRPVMEYFLSCIAESRSICISGLRVAISSMNSTPLWARWMAPASTRSWAGVSSPPDWNGSWRTSPKSEPSCAPVASTKGAFSPRLWVRRSLGTFDLVLERRYWKGTNSRAAAMMPVSSCPVKNPYQIRQKMSMRAMRLRRDSVLFTSFL